MNPVLYKIGTATNPGFGPGPNPPTGENQMTKSFDQKIASLSSRIEKLARAAARVRNELRVARENLRPGVFGIEQNLADVLLAISVSKEIRDFASGAKNEGKGYLDFCDDMTSRYQGRVIKAAMAGPENSEDLARAAAALRHAAFIIN